MIYMCVCLCIYILYIYKTYIYIPEVKHLSIYFVLCFCIHIYVYCLRESHTGLPFFFFKNKIYFVLAIPGGMWDLSSPIRDPAMTPEVEVRSLNHWPAKEGPCLLF